MSFENYANKLLEAAEKFEKLTKEAKKKVSSTQKQRSGAEVTSSSKQKARR